MKLDNILLAKARIFMKVEDNIWLSKMTKREFDWAWVSQSVKEFEEFKLITSKKEGRTKRLFLTQKGRKIQELLRKINGELR